MNYNLQTKIQHVRGIGPPKAGILNRLKIHTVLDLLEHKPADYIFPGVTPIADLGPGAHALVHGTVGKIYRKPTQAPIVSAIIHDDTGNIEAVWFGQVWLLNQIKPGMKIAVWGKVGFGRETRYQFSGPKFSTFIGSTKDVAGGLYGKYTEIIRGALKEVLGRVEIPEWWNSPYLNDRWSRKEAFEGLHRPEDKDVYSASIDRLKFDELLLQQTALAVRRRQQTRQKAAVIEI
jgi:ATP-dependent DNA helicase RecG